MRGAETAESIFQMSLEEAQAPRCSPAVGRSLFLVRPGVLCPPSLKEPRLKGRHTGWGPWLPPSPFGPLTHSFTVIQSVPRAQVPQPGAPSFLLPRGPRLHPRLNDFMVVNFLPVSLSFKFICGVAWRPRHFYVYVVESF